MKIKYLIIVGFIFFLFSGASGSYIIQDDDTWGIEVEVAPPAPVYNYSIENNGSWGIEVEVAPPASISYQVVTSSNWGIEQKIEYYVYTDYSDYWLMYYNGSAPIIVKGNASISDGEVNVSESVDSFSCYIYHPNGNSMDWTIETVPDIGSNYSSDFNGTIATDLSFSSGENTYIIYVNATDGFYSDNETFTFISEASAPEVHTLEASAVNATSAILNGYLNATGNGTCTVWFEYGATISYGNNTNIKYQNTTGKFSTTDQSLNMTLRPDESGALTQIGYEDPSGSSHYTLVDDVVSDDMTTVVYEVPDTWTGHPYATDLYTASIDSYNVNDVINNVTIYNYVYGSSGGYRYYRTALRSESTTEYGSIMTPGSGWHLISTKYEHNPVTASAWNWTQIENLQIGTSITGEHNENGICTMVYAVVNSSSNVQDLNLNPSTTYHYRSVVQNNNSTVYGNHKTFTTLSDAINNFTAINYNSTSINLTWDATTGADSVYIIYKKSSPPTSINDGFLLVNESINITYNHTGLGFGSHYYYRSYAWNTTTGFGGYSTSDNYTNPGPPLSITDIGSSLITIDVQWYGGTNATNTVVFKNSSGETYPSRFNGTECSNKTNNPTPTTDTIGGLVANTTYYFTAYSFNPLSGLWSETNISFSASTSEEAGQPSNFVATPHNHSVMNLSWTKANPTGKTILVRKTGSYPTNVNDGSQIYNGTSNRYQDTDLSPATIYYYRAWGYHSEEVSDGYASAMNYTLPEPPQDLIGTLSGTTLDVEWTIGEGATRTIISMNLSGYQSDPTYSDDVQYNGTSNSTVINGVNDINYIAGWSYVFLNGDHVYSKRQLLRWGGLEVNVYKETNPTIEIENYTVFITNQDGSETYLNNSATNPFRISVDDVPHGQDIAIQISKEGYHTRTKYYDLYENFWYSINFYLPPDTEGGGSTDEDDYIPPSDTEDILKTTSVNITNPSSSVSMTLDCVPNEIVGVYVFNKSIYAGWIEVPETDYSLLDDVLTIDPTVLDDNSTMAKAQYYCSNNESYASHYIIQVEDEVANRIEDVKIQIKRYINTTGVYDTVYILYTDANGEASVWLIPGVIYKVTLSKNGYTTISGDDYEPPIINYVEDAIKLYRMYHEIDDDDFLIFDDYITFNATINDTGTIKVCYDDQLLGTIDTDIYVYEQYNQSKTLIDHNHSTSDSFCYYINNGNTSRVYILYLYYNNSNDYNADPPIIIYIYPSNYTHGKTTIYTQESIDYYLTRTLGHNPLGWGNSIAVVIALIVLCSFSPFHAGTAIIGAGSSLVAVELIFIFNNLVLVAIIPLIITIGVFYIITVRPEAHI